MTHTPTTPWSTVTHTLTTTMNHTMTHTLTTIMNHTLTHRDLHHEPTNLKPTHTTYPATIVNTNLDLNPLPPPPPLKSMIVSKTTTQKKIKIKPTMSKTQTHGEQIPNPQRAHPDFIQPPKHNPISTQTQTQTPPNRHSKGRPKRWPNFDPNITVSKLEFTRGGKKTKEFGDAETERGWGKRGKREVRKRVAKNTHTHTHTHTHRVWIKHTFFFFYTSNEQWGCIYTTSLFADVNNFCKYILSWSVFLSGWWLK